MMKNSTLGLYVHIPFCVRKCNYCDFLSGAATEEQMTDYCQCLRREMGLWKNDPRIRNREVDTIFIGGGTPSLLSVENMTRVVDGIYDAFMIADAPEFSLECNPGTVTEEKLRCYRRLHINRLSIGLQSAIDAELAELGRIHTYEDFLKTFRMAREVGFGNINIDIMAAIPGQTADSYRTTLERVRDLGPEHISAYSLMIEEGTPFYAKYADRPPVDEDTDREMYECTGNMLAQAGYRRYEISNYAREGYHCRHNMKYWRRKEYLGAGLGAASFLGKERFSSIRLMDAYKEQILAGKKPIAETISLTTDDEMAEFMFLGLRCMKGVSAAGFRECFGVKLMDAYGEEINRLTAQGLLAEQGGSIFLTKRGIDVSNPVLAEFIREGSI